LMIQSVLVGRKRQDSARNS